MTSPLLRKEKQKTDFSECPSVSKALVSKPLSKQVFQNVLHSSKTPGAAWPLKRSIRKLLLRALATSMTFSMLGLFPFQGSLKGATGWQTGIVLAQSSVPPSTSPTGLTSQLTDYARAVLEIEPIRLKYYQQAEQLMRRGQIPQNTCLGNNKANVPQGLEGICNGYLNDSKQVIERNNLTPEQFNEITLRARTDTSLMTRIQQELVKLRRSRQP
jgi:hypothetical protein